MTTLNKIHILSPKLANQIAAGEVIERPASVVKELMENAIDANAKSITLSIEKGGIDSIVISDDGDGIHHQDLPLTIQQHATSKVISEKDLEAINTLGFRGEALASIASISELTLRSKVDDYENGWMLTTSGNPERYEIKPTAQTKGTRIEVNNLFFNTPARRKFLRTERTEYHHIEQLFKRIALSHFDIQFILNHNGKQTKRLDPAETKHDQELRIQKLFGKDFVQNSYQIKYEHQDLKLSGWLGSPSLSSYQNDKQCCFINGRLVKDKLLNHAIRSAYGELLNKHEYPCYVIHLTIDPKTIDVNVHPTKHEVRFSEPRLIYDFIVKSLQSALLEQPQGNINYQPLAQSSRLFHANDKGAPFQYNDQPTTNYNYHSKYFGQLLNISQNKWVITESSDGFYFIPSDKIHSHHLKTKWLEQLNHSSVSQSPMLVPKTLSTDATKIEAKVDIISDAGFNVSCSGPQTLMIRSIPQLLKHIDTDEVLKILKEVANMTLESTNDLIELFIKELSASNTWQTIPCTMVTEFIQTLDNESELNLKEFSHFIPHSELTLEK